LEQLSFDYACLADELSPSGTFHTHIYVYANAPIRFSRIKKLFPSAHIEKARGTSRENREYVQKSGKWSADEKADTRIDGTFQELGIFPTERVSAEDKKEKLHSMVENGMSAKEIIDTDKDYIYRLRNIDDFIQLSRFEKYREVIRDVEVVYIYGDTGTGKTRGIYKKHNNKDICRVTSYRSNGNYFDAYNGESVLVFEEFNSQIPIEEMLNFTDIYPLMLPARYQDRVASYTTVYITSNKKLESQYIEVQHSNPKTWEAFLRRITKIIEYKSTGEVIEYFPERNTKNV
jgi:hypothetical protein